MLKRTKISKKWLSTEVNSVRPYKSRSSRPCDFCRKRKTCCIIQDLIPCMACASFNKGVCTFLEGPIKRVARKNTSVDTVNTLPQASELNNSAENGRRRTNKPKTNQTHSTGDFSSFDENSSTIQDDSIYSTQNSLQVLDCSSPQSLKLYDTLPAGLIGDVYGDYSGGLSMPITKPRYQSDNVFGSNLECPPSPSQSIQSEIGVVGVPRRAVSNTFSSSSASNHAYTNHLAMQSMDITPASGAAPISVYSHIHRQPYVASYYHSNSTVAPCNADMDYFPPQPMSFESNSIRGEESSILLQTWNDENTHASTAKYTPQMMYSGTDSYQQPTPLSSVSMRANGSTFERLFPGDEPAKNEIFHTRLHNQFQERLQQKDYDMYAGTHEAYTAGNFPSTNISTDLILSTSYHPFLQEAAAKKALLAPLYQQLYLPLDHAIPEPLFLAD